MDFIQRLIHALTQLHPPHPIFVHFPIGLTGGAAFFILLALWRRSDLLEKIAFANISLASVSAIVAAIVGMRDNVAFYNGHANNYVVKIILAMLLFVITGATAIVRWRKPDLFHNASTKALYVAAYFVSFTIVIVLGFLGGVIIYGF